MNKELHQITGYNLDLDLVIRSGVYLLGKFFLDSFFFFASHGLLSAIGKNATVSLE